MIENSLKNHAVLEINLITFAFTEYNPIDNLTYKL